MQRLLEAGWSKEEAAEQIEKDGGGSAGFAPKPPKDMPPGKRGGTKRPPGTTATSPPAAPPPPAPPPGPPPDSMGRCPSATAFATALAPASAPAFHKLNVKVPPAFRTSLTTLHLRTPNGQQRCEGRYAVVEHPPYTHCVWGVVVEGARPNGRPLWKHDAEDFWLY
eukprot:gene57380-biopygen1655